MCLKLCMFSEANIICHFVIHFVIHNMLGANSLLSLAVDVHGEAFICIRPLCPIGIGQNLDHVKGHRFYENYNPKI